MSERTSRTDRTSHPRSQPARASTLDSLRALIRTEGLLRRLAEPHFARFGISPAQWGVLRSLARLEDSGNAHPRMRELGAALVVQPPSLSATLDRMERAGLVARRDDPDDHRTRRVALTVGGRTLLNRVFPEHMVWVDKVMAGLSSRENATLGSLLRKLGEHMDAVAAEPHPAGLARSKAKRKRSTS